MNPRLDAELVRKKWLCALGSTDPALLERRILWDGRDPEALGAMIHEFATVAGPVETHPGREPGESASAVALKMIRTAIRASIGQTLQDLAPRVRDNSNAYLPFSDLWGPAVDFAVSEAKTRLHCAIGVEVSGSVLKNLARTLLSRFCAVGEHALAELFLAERGIGALILEQCAPDTSDAPPARGQYRDFIERHRSDGLESLLTQFPVLGRLLANELILWLESAVEMLERVHGDRDLLLSVFEIPAGAPLGSIHQSMGDRHCGGRSVAILMFADGANSWTVVYKPRDLGMDAEYQRTLLEINSSGALPPLMTSKILVRNGYGYMEYIQHQPCADDRALELFYYNAGRLSSILYVFGCTDCHNENLIANRHQLALVDAETLLEPEVSDDVRKVSQRAFESKSRLRIMFDDSTARCDFLPVWSFAGTQQHAFDTSALGTNTASQEPEIREGWRNVNTDRMTRGTVEHPPLLPASSPVWFGNDNPLERNLPSFCAGFADQASELVRNKREWVRTGGLLDRFAGLTRRLVLRATRIYGAIQTQQLQAEALRSEINQRMKLEQLGRLYLTAQQRPKDWPAFAAEIRHMQALDVPYFRHRVDATEMPLGQNDATISDYFATSGLEACRRRLSSLDPSVIEFQLRLIQGVVAAKQLEAHCSPTVPRRTPPTASTDARDFDRLNAVESIARKLMDLALDDGAQWLGFDLAADCRRFIYRPLSMSLYSGSLGIAVFLSCVEKSRAVLALPPVPDIQDSLQRVLEPVVRLSETAQRDHLRRWWRDQPLGLAGVAGQLLALIAFDDLGVRPHGFQSSRDLACELLEGLDESRIGRSIRLDLMSGELGLIGPLLRLGTRQSLAIAKLIGDRLIAEPDAPELQSRFSVSPLGFSNGAAGAVAALGQLYRHTNNPALRALLSRVLLSHRAQIEARDEQMKVGSTAPPGGRELSGSWCHGLAGTALGRLSLKGTDLWNPALECETQAILKDLEASDFPNDSLCCGTLGGAMVLRIASEMLDDPRWQSCSGRLETLFVAERLDECGRWRLSDLQQMCLNRPGLMNGASGIGLSLIHDWYGARTWKTLLSAGLCLNR